MNPKEHRGGLPGRVRRESNATDAANHGPTKQVPILDHPGGQTHKKMFGQGPDQTPLDGFQRTRKETIRSANCTVLFQNGNCNSGDDSWTPDDGNWGSYPGISGTTNQSAGTIMAQATPGNPSGYDFVGGQTTSVTSLTSFREPVVGSYSTVETTDLQVKQERTMQNCNCGTGGVSDDNYNCYSNCNCNCNCACDCVCACDCQSPCCCVTGDTLVWMGDHSYRRIDEIKVGDEIMTFDGPIAVQGVDITTVGARPVYDVNEVLSITGDHAFWVEGKGWASIDPAASDRSKNKMLDIVVDAVGNVRPRLYEGIKETPAQLVVGDVSNGVVVDSITPSHTPEDVKLYTLVTGGYMVADRFILSAWAVDDLEL